MTRLCSICARGSSKGVINKNLREIAGKPLITHTIEHAIESKCFDYLSVSSDSKEILDISIESGANFAIERPKELATDTSAKLPAIQHCASATEGLTNKAFDIFVDLDATSPLRLPQDIVESINKLENSDSLNLITGSPARRSPYFNLVELNKNGFVIRSKELEQSIIRRQDSPQCYDMNASIYVWKRENFFNHQKVLLDNTILYEMPEERSIDIDTELDFKLVKFLLENK